MCEFDMCGLEFYVCGMMWWYHHNYYWLKNINEK